MTMITPDFSARPETTVSNEVADPITELLRSHARELIAVALEAEVQLVMNQLRRDGRDVVRNGYLPERDLTTAVGDVTVEVPRIRSRDGEPVNFASSMVPKYLRRSTSIDAWAGLRLPKGHQRKRTSPGVSWSHTRRRREEAHPGSAVVVEIGLDAAVPRVAHPRSLVDEPRLPLRRRHLPEDPRRSPQDLCAWC